MATPLSTFGYVLRGTTTDNDYVQNPVAEDVNCNGHAFNNMGSLAVETIAPPPTGTLDISCNSIELGDVGHTLTLTVDSSDRLLVDGNVIYPATTPQLTGLMYDASFNVSGGSPSLIITDGGVIDSANRTLATFYIYLNGWTAVGTQKILTIAAQMNPSGGTVGTRAINVDLASITPAGGTGWAFNNTMVVLHIPISTAAVHGFDISILPGGNTTSVAGHIKVLGVYY